MPHARLCCEPDWQLAIETVELAATTFDSPDLKVGLLAELRYREKVLGTTWSAWRVPAQ